ncbi:MAG: glycoside hydrolase family protein [Jejuia sp.]
MKVKITENEVINTKLSNGILACLSLLLVLHFSVYAQKDDKKLVFGGQFKDIIKPMPIIKKLTSKGIWGTDDVLPRDINNGLESNDWSYWGGNPMLGKDDKYHINVARWPEEKGHWGWPKSEVAHAVSKNPIGPYKVTGIALKEAHNPEVVQLNNGAYMLHVSKGGVYTSETLDGPWQFLGKIKIDKRRHKGLSHLNTNLTGLQRADGSFMFFTKRGDVMISKTGLLGPYEIISVRNYDRYSGYPEDPVIWKSRHQYHVVFNHAVDKKSVYMRSLDGINWKIEPGEPYDKTVFRYTDGTTNTWTKFERPKVQQDEYGRATHLSLAVIDVEKKEDLGNDNHSSKHVILPLVTERLIEVINTDNITENTKNVNIRIKAEKGFNPTKDVNIESLRLGGSEVVNYGGGAVVSTSEELNGDLILTFNWHGTKLNTSNYDLKLLGETNSGNMLYGYALLPQYKEDPAALVTLPIKIEEGILKTQVENFGLKPSNPVVLKVYTYANEEWQVIKQLKIPALKPYEISKINIPIKDVEGVYEVRISDTNTSFWNKVDDNHYTIVYKGNWNANKEGQDIYLGSEQVTSQKGASATFFFNGTQARCYGLISKNMGGFEVYIDDVYVENIDCYFKNPLHDSVIYQTEVLPLGLHKLELKATGKHYKGNPVGPVTIDAFSYLD